MSQLSLFLIGYQYVPDGSDNKFYEITNDKIGFHINWSNDRWSLSKSLKGYGLYGWVAR